MAKETKKNAEIKSSENTRNPYFNLDAEKAFFEEVDEDVRNERFKELINKYGGYILAVLILALSFAVGYEKIGEWRLRKSEQRNIQYVQATSPSSDYENNLVALENIVATESGLYKDMAHLQIANVLIANNQLEKGLSVLNDICNDDTIIDKVREMAAVKLASYKIDTASFAEIEAILNPVIAKNGAWATMAKEFLAMSAIQNNDVEKAQTIYQEILTNNNISDELKARINDILANINNAQ